MIRPRPLSLSVAAICGACSLHSLDYLGTGEPGGAGSAGGVATGGAGGSAPAAAGEQSGGVAGIASGGGSVAGSSSTGGSSSSAGSDSAGAAGAPPEVPDCMDDVRTLDETDIDCGGRTCAPCDADARCVTGTDCSSAICTNQVCQPPTCVDLAINGAETDLNCGGGCPKCAEGRRCLVDADCATGKCGLGICYSPMCSPGVLQGGCALLVDNTPYALLPQHAPDKCIDDAGRSVADGTGMVLYACNSAPNQAFWTIAQDGGYFAFQNALSGKCLQLRGASIDAGVVVEQSGCNFASGQLWKPERVDDQYMLLRSKLSGLLLDVAGTNVTTNNQPIVQGTQASSADTHWRLQKRSAGAHIALAPNDDTSLHVTHADDLTTVTTEDDDESSHFRVVPGLNDPSGVSFQCRDDPGRYLRHSDFRVWSDTNDGSVEFKRDATFRLVNPLVGTATLTHAIESINYPGYFLQRDGEAMLLTQLVDSPKYRSAATWWLMPR